MPKNVIASYRHDVCASNIRIRSRKGVISLAKGHDTQDGMCIRSSAYSISNDRYRAKIHFTTLSYKVKVVNVS